MLLTEEHIPRLACRIPEKAKTFREFMTTPRIQAAIKVRSDTLRGLGISVTSTSYIFGTDDLSKPYPTRKIQEGIRDLAKRAGVGDISVHPHLFRHTIVERLVEAGNSMETVSKYMGHRQVQTTNAYYFITPISELQNLMNNPFTGSFQRKAQPESESELESLNDRLEIAARYICDQRSLLQVAAAQGLSAAEALLMADAKLPDTLDFVRAILDVASTSRAPTTVAPRQAPAEALASLEAEAPAEALTSLEAEAPPESETLPQSHSVALEPSTPRPQKKRRR
jgi:hypothetical protein